MFKHFINEVELKKEPGNWENFTINIVRDTDAQALVIQYPLTLVFQGDGWEILKAVFDQPDGYCQDLDYRAEKSCDKGFKTIVRGKIFISQVRFNLNKCTAEATIEDNSFFARIFNNKNLPVKIDVGLSKNEIVITPTPISPIVLFTPSTGVNIAPARSMYDIKDVFTYLTSWMSDGELGFRSGFYDNLDDDKNSAIVLGEEVRSGGLSDSSPTVSFDDVWDDQRKLYNLLMTIETDEDGSVFLRIEDDAFFFGTDSVFTLDKIDDMFEQVMEEKLFSSVKFGSPGSGTEGEFPQVTFQSWNDETFIVSGQCNSDNELELQVEAVTNSNVIEEIIGGDDNFDEDIVFIQYTKSTLIATKTNPQPATPAITVYNEEYLNSLVSTRYDLQGDITKRIGDGNDGFRASSTASEFLAVVAPAFPNPFIFPFPFDDDFTPPNNDPNGNYDPVLFRYTAPLDGIYTFNATMFYRWNTLNSQFGSMTIALERYNAADVLQESFAIVQDTQSTANPAPNTPYTAIGIPRAFNLLATDYVVVRILGFIFGVPSVDGELELLADSFFETTATANGGGLYAEKDIDEYRVIGVEFDRTLNAEQIEDIVNQPFKAITVNNDGLTNKITYVNNVNINAYKGITNWQMLRNINNA